MSYYAHRVNSFKLLAHVNCLMGVVHTTCSTTMLIAMYFGEYPIYHLTRWNATYISDGHFFTLPRVQPPADRQPRHILASLTCTSPRLYVFLVLLYSPFDTCSVYIPTRLLRVTVLLVVLLYLAYGFTFWCSICSSRCVLKIYLSSSHIYLLVLCLL